MDIHIFQRKCEWDLSMGVEKARDKCDTDTVYQRTLHGKHHRETAKT